MDKKAKIGKMAIKMGAVGAVGMLIGGENRRKRSTKIGR
jgi:hypothetical protein